MTAYHSQFSLDVTLLTNFRLIERCFAYFAGVRKKERGRLYITHGLYGYRYKIPAYEAKWRKLYKGLADGGDFGVGAIVRSGDNRKRLICQRTLNDLMPYLHQYIRTKEATQLDQEYSKYYE